MERRLARGGGSGGQKGKLVREEGGSGGKEGRMARGGGSGGQEGRLAREEGEGMEGWRERRAENGQFPAVWTSPATEPPDPELRCCTAARHTPRWAVGRQGRKASTGQVGGWCRPVVVRAEVGGCGRVRCKKYAKMVSFRPSH